MKRMQYIGIFLFIFFSAVSYAKLSAEIKPQSARLHETLTLIITDDSNAVQNLPDLTPLQNDFAILGTQRSFSYYSVNGQTTNVAEWTILLRAKKAGKLTIPSLSFSQGNTNPLTVQIKQEGDNDTSKVAAENTQKDIVLTAEADTTEPYIHQQIIYTIKLYNSRRLLDSQYQPPEVENALIIPLGDSRQYQRVEEGKAWMVAEQRYAIFPQKSGKLTIVPPVFTVLAYDVVPTELKTSNKPMVLEVKPAPVPHSQSWLPAKDLNLTETWDVHEKNLDQGSTVTRTIQIEAKGIPAQFLQSLPALELGDKDGFRAYLEKGKQTNIIRDGDLLGKYNLKITYLFDKPGTVTIPELKLPWFAINTGKEETAALPPRTFQIQASDYANAQSATPPTSANTDTPSVKMPVSTEKEPPQAISSPVAWILAGLFAAAWLLTIGFWLLQKYASRPGSKRYKASLDNLHTACMNNDPCQARTSVLDWARLYWPDARILNMGDIMALTGDIKLKQQLHILSNLLYSQGEKPLWNGEALWRAISDFLKLKTGSKPKKNSLPPMNPG